jgi:hypothetical protein
VSLVSPTALQSGDTMVETRPRKIRDRTQVDKSGTLRSFGKGLAKSAKEP